MGILNILFRRESKQPTSVPIAQVAWPDKDRPQPPHCDAAILHAPGACDYCDKRLDWQYARAYWGINYTGVNDPDKLPCPSEVHRKLEVIEQWPGNQPKHTVK